LKVGRPATPVSVASPALQVDHHAILGQFARHDARHTLGRGLARLHRQNAAPVMLQNEADIRARHGQTADHIQTGGIFAARAAQEFAPRRDLAEQVLDPDARPRRQSGGPFLHHRAMVDHPAPATVGPRTRLSMVSRATEAMEGKASPRKPSVVTISIASSGSFEVACRSSASAIWSASIAQPSSVTSMPSSPPCVRRTVIWPDPASMAFSTSSFRAEAGRSTTPLRQCG
jgi:hypothetical protein